MSEDLKELLRRYARRGLADWQKLPQKKRRTCNQLGLKIIEKDWQISNMLSKNPTDSYFIPMPKVNHRGVEHCFFLPIRSPHKNGVKFELFLVVDKQNCLGFRFEAADTKGTHNYNHVQITRQMTLSAKGIPTWLPESYPAFPISSTEPLDMFLYMATSVHGYKDGMQQVIEDIFQDNPSVGKSTVQRWQERLSLMLRP